MTKRISPVMRNAKIVKYWKGAVFSEAILPARLSPELTLMPLMCSSVDDLIRYCILNDLKIPTYVFCSYIKQYHLSLESCLAHADVQLGPSPTQGGYEKCTVAGREALSAAIDTFNSQNQYITNTVMDITKRTRVKDYM